MVFSFLRCAVCGELTCGFFDDVPQFEFLDLSRWRRRHFVQNYQPLGDVLKRNLLRLEEIRHGGQVDRLPLLRHYDSATALAQPLVGIGHDGNLADSWMLIEKWLDLH